MNPKLPGEVRSPHRPCVASYIGKSYDVHSRACDVTKMSYSDVISVFLRHHITMLCHDDVSNCAHLSTSRVSNLMRTRWQVRAYKNATLNTPYVTPSPTYLEAPSLPEPSTALMFEQKVPIQIHIKRRTMSSYMKPYHAPYFSRTDVSKTDLCIIDTDKFIEILINTAVLIMGNTASPMLLLYIIFIRFSLLRFPLHCAVQLLLICNRVY